MLLRSARRWRLRLRAGAQWYRSVRCEWLLQREWTVSDRDLCGVHVSQATLLRSRDGATAADCVRSASLFASLCYLREHRRARSLHPSSAPFRDDAVLPHASWSDDRLSLRGHARAERAQSEPRAAQHTATKQPTSLSQPKFRKPTRPHSADHSPRPHCTPLCCSRSHLRHSSSPSPRSGLLCSTLTRAFFNSQHPSCATATHRYSSLQSTAAPVRISAAAAARRRCAQLHSIARSRR